MKKLFVLIMAIVISIPFSGCFVIEEEQVYHEGVEELEHYIIDELGDYILFDEPTYEDSYIRGDNKQTVIWYVVFVRQYIYGNEVENYPPELVVERTRELYNCYLRDNPDYLLKDYVVEMRFLIPPSMETTNRPYTEFITCSNYDYVKKSVDGELTSIEVLNGSWNLFFDRKDICSAKMTSCALDQIIEVADNMPHLKYILVKDQETAEKASNLRPDMKFYYVSEEYYKSQD